MKTPKLLTMCALSAGLFAAVTTVPAFAKHKAQTTQTASTTSTESTNDSREQIKTIEDDSNAQIKAINADKTLSKKDRSTRIKAVQADRKTKISAIKTAAHQQKLDAKKVKKDSAEKTPSA